jgi:hypothetical protein
MKACLDEKSFNRFMEDALKSGEEEAIEHHIKKCPSCAKEYASWQKLKDQLDEASEIPVPQGFKDKIMTRIATEKIQAAPISLRRILAFAVTILALIYSIMDLFFRPDLNEFTTSLIKGISEYLYRLLDGLGIDPVILFKLFGNIMSRMDSLVWLAAGGTVLTAAAFLVLFRKGRMKARA